MKVDRPIKSWVVKSNGKVVFQSFFIVSCYDYIAKNNLDCKPIANYGG